MLAAAQRSEVPHPESHSLLEAGLDRGLGPPGSQVMVLPTPTPPDTSSHLVFLHLICFPWIDFSPLPHPLPSRLFLVLFSASFTLQTDFLSFAEVGGTSYPMAFSFISTLFPPPFQEPLKHTGPKIPCLPFAPLAPKCWYFPSRTTPPPFIVRWQNLLIMTTPGAHPSVLIQGCTSY